jgi:hypothetical protein
MYSLPQSPRKSVKLVATLGIGLLPSLPLLAQPTEQSPVNISRSGTVRDPNPPLIDPALRSQRNSCRTGTRDSWRSLRQRAATAKVSRIQLPPCMRVAGSFRPRMRSLEGRDAQLRVLSPVNPGEGDAQRTASERQRNGYIPEWA